MTIYYNDYIKLIINPRAINNIEFIPLLIIFIMININNYYLIYQN